VDVVKGSEKPYKSTSSGDFAEVVVRTVRVIEFNG
jgi:hypothetical protein